MNAKEVLATAPDKIGKIASKHIPSVTAAGIQIDREIKEKEIVLAAIKARLVAEGEKEFAREHAADPAKFPTQAGTSWTFVSDDGEAAQVSFPNDGFIKGGFHLVEEMAFKTVGQKAVPIGKLREIAGMAFERLFQTFYKPKKAFEEIARALVPEKAEQLLGLIREAQSPRVSFKTKE